MQNIIFYLRKMIDADHKNFLELSDAEAGVSCTSDERFGSIFLGTCQRNTIIFSIIDKCTGNYIGYVMVQHIDTATPELGISIRPEYRSHGIGNAALKATSQMYRKTHHTIDYFLIRVKAYNKASQRRVEKLGAQRLDDEGDVMLDVVKKFTREIGGEQGNKLLTKFWTDIMLKTKMCSDIDMMLNNFTPSIDFQTKRMGGKLPRPCA